ncbi:AAA family ATPase (plasmid) [Cereibacter azotoformans]|uniref:AAA family ATPase n=1 Tax=Cereibacter azotoformans TaxID=43057 RepID=UPI001EEBBB4B|nr:ATP-binding protein [Cereibacter azotoformans]ULB12752.1 AAA family ATPase [Cereibacter azotoformans]
MSRYFLSSAAIDGFRGINNDGDPLVLKFKHDAVNSVHAPNGVGKSSIFEALHFALHGTVPRLEEMQDAEQGASYIVNKFHPAQRATVALVFKSDDGTPDVSITVTRTAAGGRVVTSPSGHADPDSFLADLCEDFVLVDYPRFASLVDCSALDRGRSFASLVGMSRYSQLRQALEGAKNTRNINGDLGLSTLETEVIAENRALGAVEQRILAAHQEVTSAAGGQMADTATLKAQVTSGLACIALLAPLLANASVMELDFDAAEKVVDQEEGGSARKALDDLNSAVTTLSGLQVSAAELAEIDELVSMAKSRDEAMRKVGAASLHALLKDALAVVNSADWHDPRVCPVCEKAGDGPLQDQLEAKIALYDEADQLDAELKRQVQSAGCIGKLRQIEEQARLGVADADRIAPVLTLAARQSSVSTADLERARDALGALEAKRVDVLAAINAEITTLQASLPPSLVAVTRTLGQAKQFRDAMNEYERTLPALAAKRAKLAKLIRWKTFITNVAGQFANAESALANARITDIQASCQELFGHLVRGGPDVRPTLNRAQNTEQVDLKLADFFGLPNQSARALLSESYRNAVAASIFLAAATRQQGVPRFMVLDDVTSSFDAGHQFSLMDTIRTKLRFGAANGLPGGLQFIILSHDSSLEKYFDRLNGTTEWNHQKLQGMPPRGRLMIAAQQADRLKAQAEQYLNAGQIDIGEPFVRQYLEYKLGQIITRLEIPVPPDYATRGDKRTLSTYVEAITAAVAIYQAAQRCVLSAPQITDLQNHHLPSIMANYVSHYETGAGNPFNAYALLGVLQSVDALADCFRWTDPADNQRKYYRRLDRR